MSKVTLGTTPRTKAAKEAQLTGKVVEDYLWAKAYRDQFKDDWHRYYRLYRSHIAHPDVKYPYESQVFVPYVFSIIETQLPILIQQLFQSGDFVDVQGRKIQSELNAPAVKEILAYQFERNIHAFEMAYLWGKQALLYGTSPVLADWDFRTRRIKARIPETLLNGTIIGERTENIDKVIANNPIARVIDLFRYFQCPTTPQSPSTSDDVLFAGWEFAATLEELRLGTHNGIYNENTKQLTDADGSDQAFQYLEDRLETLGKTGPLGVSSERRMQIPCINYMGLLPDRTGTLTSRLVTLAFPSGLPHESGGQEAAIVIRNDENPYHSERIPITLCRVNQNVDELYGIGDVEAVSSLQTELTDQRNQRHDLLVRLMNQMFKVRRGANIDEAQLQYRPSGTVEVDEMDDIQELIQNPAQIQSSFMEGEEIKRDMQFASGISDFVVGQFQNSSGFNDTATGISLIQSAAENRIILKGQWLQTAIKDLAETVWMLDQQFLPFDTVVKVLDPISAAKYRFIRATPAIIQGQYDFSIVNAPAAGNPMMRRQQLIQVMQALVQMMPIAQQSGQQLNIDFGNLMRRLLEEFDIPNIAEIFPGLADMGLINDIPDAFDAEQNVGDSLDPQTENQLIIQEGAKDLPTHPGDDDVEHIIDHEKAKLATSQSAQAELTKHVTMHSLQLQQKKQLLIETLRSTAQGIMQGEPAATPPVGTESGEEQDITKVGEGSLVNTLAQGIRTTGR